MVKAVIRIVETENFVLFSLKNNLKSKTMIQFYPKYKQFKALVDAKDYENAVRSGLDYLRFVADEYIRLEVYAYQEYDGDDFLTY